MKIIRLGGLILLGVIAFQASLLKTPEPVAAVATITVNSKEDDIDDDGECTLREAIIAANDNSASGITPGECEAGDSGNDLVNFGLDISDTPDFTIGGQNGYTIKPQPELPTITETITIDGYSQAGSSPNSSPSPQPLNGTILIQIDGIDAGSNQNGLIFNGGASGSANSVIRGLAINNFNENGVVVGAQNITFSGNYIGVSADGTTDQGNGFAGFSHMGMPASNGALIGGLNPADRNLISGNGSSGIFPITDWVIQGNYVGTNASGTAAIPNATNDGAGALSIDDCENVLVGGTDAGAANLISGNTTFGIAPHACPGTVIEGNLIGTDWTGEAALPNLVGIAMSDNQTGSVIGGTSVAARNIISGNSLAGILSSSSGQLRIEGNYVGLDISGNNALPNSLGIILSDDSIIGGSTASRNIISGNSIFNVSVQGAMWDSVNAEVSSNYIGTDANGNISSAITNVQGEGVRVSARSINTVIGGEGKGNRIAGNRGSGVGIRQTEVPSMPATMTPENIAIISNEIYGNITGGPIADAEGLGIDIYNATIDDIGSQPIPADVSADNYTDLGVNANDVGDPDSGVNNFMNFPVLHGSTQTGTNLSVNLDLDAADSTSGQYRVEFFANDTSDSSGHGEGQTYLGFADLSTGDGQTASITLANNIDLSGKTLSATTTSHASTPSGFGATSEFSEVASIDVIAATDNQDGSNSLADTGEDDMLVGVVGGLALIISSAFIYRRTKESVIVAL